jgi:hypothetical protein
MTVEPLTNNNEQFCGWYLIKNKSGFLTTIGTFIQAQKRSFPERM